MKQKILGRTGLGVTVAGLGCGGYSRLGSRKFGKEHAVRMVRYAYDAGVNLFDTAVMYQTQPMVGAGLSGLPRDSYILSTKFEPGAEGEKRPEDLAAVVESCLWELQTDYIDVFHMHQVLPEHYDYMRQYYYPELQKLQQQGKIRYLGITENFYRDPTHRMLARAVDDGIFDSIMIGYNILNPAAAHHVLPAAREKNIGVMCMYAIRSTFRDPASLSDMLRDLAARGKIDPAIKDLDFLLRDGYARTLAEAGCRFCANEESIHSVLTGAGTTAHLDENIASITGAPLPAEVVDRLKEMFQFSDAVPEL